MRRPRPASPSRRRRCPGAKGRRRTRRPTRTRPRRSAARSTAACPVRHRGGLAPRRRAHRGHRRRPRALAGPAQAARRRLRALVRQRRLRGNPCLGAAPRRGALRRGVGRRAHGGRDRPFVHAWRRTGRRGARHRLQDGRLGLRDPRAAARKAPAAGPMLCLCAVVAGLRRGGSCASCASSAPNPRTRTAPRRRPAPASPRPCRTASPGPTSKTYGAPSRRPVPRRPGLNAAGHPPSASRRPIVPHAPARRDADGLPAFLRL